jgi:predicted nucleotidyltransferase
MGMQFIVVGSTIDEMSRHLQQLKTPVEIFSIDQERLGVNVPMETVEQFGEQNLLHLLSKVNAYDLFAGKWIGSAR